MLYGPYSMVKLTSITPSDMIEIVFGLLVSTVSMCRDSMCRVSDFDYVPLCLFDVQPKLFRPSLTEYVYFRSTFSHKNLSVLTVSIQIIYKIVQQDFSPKDGARDYFIEGVSRRGIRDFSFLPKRYTGDHQHDIQKIHYHLT